MSIIKFLVVSNTHRPFWGASLRRNQPLPTSPAPRRHQWKPPAALQSKDPYKVLQVTRDSSLAEIKAAYYQKIKLLHPDLNENDTTEEAVVLNIAYAALLQGKKLTWLQLNTDTSLQLTKIFLIIIIYRLL
jgi:DnaJ domain